MPKSRYGAVKQESPGFSHGECVNKLSGEGQLQLENQLPVKIDKPCYIPKEHFHRLLNIKDLRVLIIEK